MNTIRLESVDSTNAWAARNHASLPLPSMVWALSQTSGRGQRGNSWEAEPRRNLTASFIFEPSGVAPENQFAISEAVALAVVDFLRTLGLSPSVKWPNDIYVGDRKICGILIEHSLLGQRITHSVAGIGINLNQKEFLSDAPNPVSVIQLTGKETPLESAARDLAHALENRLAMLPDRQRLHEEFLSSLWRADGKLHPFTDRMNGQLFLASIADVAPDGHLLLLSDSGRQRSFAFKEVEFILNPKSDISSL